MLSWKSLSEGQSGGSAFRQAKHFNRLPALPASFPQEVEDQIDRTFLPVAGLNGGPRKPVITPSL